MLMHLLIAFALNSSVVMAQGAPEPVPRAFPPLAKGEASQVTDFLFTSFGAFIGDQATSNGLLRLVRTPKAAYAYVYTAGKPAFVGGRPDPSRVGKRLDGSPGRASVTPGTILARIELEATAPNSSLYKIKNVTENTNRLARNLIFMVGGTVDFAARGEGFGLGARPWIILVKDSPEAQSYRELNYFEAQVPPPEVCVEILSASEAK
jgi:hypothetical protein